MSRFGQQDASLSDILKQYPSVFLVLLDSSILMNWLKSMNQILCTRSTWKFSLNGARMTSSCRDGAWVVIIRTGTPFCPIAMLEWYMRMANILILMTSACYNGQKLRESGAVSYSYQNERTGS